MIGNIAVPAVSTRKTSSGATHSTTSYRTEKLQQTVIHELTDNGSGGLGVWGTVNYVAKTANVRLVDVSATTEGYKSDYENSSSFDQGGAGGSENSKGGGYGDSAVSEEVLAATTVTATYAIDFDDEVDASMSYAPPAVTIDLCPNTTDYIVPGSVQFTWMGHVYQDFDGFLFRDRVGSDPGFFAGQVNYSSGIVEITDYVVDGLVTAFTLNSLWTVRQKWTTGSIFMRTQAAPIKPSGFAMNLSDSQGNSITATADLSGVLTGTHLRGTIDYESGVVEMQFGDYVLDSSLTDAQKAEWWYDIDDVGAVQADKIWRPWPVDPTTLRYNSVAYFYLPIDANILGLDPVRLPQDGRVVIYRAGGLAVVGHTDQMSPATVSNGQTLDTSRTRLSRVRVIGNDGNTINAGYTTDLEAGTVTFTDVTGYSQPVTVEHRIEDMALVRDVQIDGTVSFTRPLTHDFPEGSQVSSALVATGRDMYARVSKLFDQATWDGTSWTDALVGSAATGTYNDILAPIQVTNAGALTERWALRFTTTTGGQIIGEHVGVIGNFSTATETAPLNPATGDPYFTIPALGWGTGWSIGNILRLNTVGAQFPVWVVRTVQQGPEAGTDYSFSLLTRGDVDRP